MAPVSDKLRGVHFIQDSFENVRDMETKSRVPNLEPITSAYQLFEIDPRYEDQFGPEGYAFLTE